MVRRRNYLEYPELKSCTFFGPDGTMWIKKDVSEEEYQKYKKIRAKCEYIEKFMLLHYSPIAHHSINSFYYVPDCLYNMIYYEDHRVVSKRNVPENLQSFFQDCAIYMEIDFNYYTEILGYNFKNGSSFGLKETKKNDFIIKKSKYVPQTFEEFKKEIEKRANQNSFLELFRNIKLFGQEPQNRIGTNKNIISEINSNYIKNRYHWKTNDGFPVRINEEYWYPEF